MTGNGGHALRPGTTTAGPVGYCSLLSLLGAIWMARGKGHMDGAAARPDGRPERLRLAGPPVRPPAARARRAAIERGAGRRGVSAHGAAVRRTLRGREADKAAERLGGQYSGPEAFPSRQFPGMTRGLESRGLTAAFGVPDHTAGTSAPRLSRRARRSAEVSSSVGG